MLLLSAEASCPKLVVRDYDINGDLPIPSRSRGRGATRGKERTPTLQHFGYLFRFSPVRLAVCVFWIVF